MSDMIELARRAVKCKAWRWMPGTQAAGPWRILTVGDDGYPLSCFATAHHSPRGWWGLAGQPGAARELLPDFSDPATLGCLLALVREAWGARNAVCRYSDYHNRWALGFQVSETDAAGQRIFLKEVGAGRTEAEALVAALESAP